MAVKEIAVKKDVVKPGAETRERLGTLIHSGGRPHPTEAAIPNVMNDFTGLEAKWSRPVPSGGAGLRCVDEAGILFRAVKVRIGLQQRDLTG